MLLTIFKKTLARGRISLLAFAGGMGLFEFITVVTYPAIGGTRNVQAVFEALGPDMQRLLKLAPNLQIGFGPLTYLAFGYFHPVFLGLGSAFIVARASDAIAGDIERGTLLFLLARPLKRRTLLFAKALEAALSLSLVVAGAGLGTGFGLLLTDLRQPVAFWPFVVIGLNALALFLALGGVALVLSALSNSAARVAGWATGFALMAFVADFLTGLPIIGIVGILSPFRYYDPQAIVASGGALPWASLALLSGTGLLGLGVASYLFERRDIAA